MWGRNPWGYGAPHESPPYGAVLVTQPGIGPEILSGGDPYFVHRTDHDQWWGCDLVGLYDQLTHYAHVIDCVRVGRWLRTPDWQEIQRRARRQCKRDR
jgi:hypothetical protein